MAQHLTTVVVAKMIRTMDETRPSATAVAVNGGRIVAVGSLDEVIDSIAGESFEIDHTHADDVLLPGLIDQHLHPLLAATTLATEVIATEDWVLPERTFEAANSHEQYLARLAAAEAGLADPDEWLISWGWRPVLSTARPRRDVSPGPSNVSMSPRHSPPSRSGPPSRGGWKTNWAASLPANGRRSPCSATIPTRWIRSTCT